MTSVYLPELPLALQEYQTWVTTMREPRQSEYGSNWETSYATYIAGEQQEFLTQHGHGFMLLLPEGTSAYDPAGKRELQYKMADELGDLVWFSTDTATRRGHPVAELCVKALWNHTGKSAAEISVFEDIEQQAIKYAGQISVPNKWGLLNPGSTSRHAMTSLADNPNYVFVRAGNRLCRSLDDSTLQLSPPTSERIEPPQDTLTALGTYFLAMAYVSRSCLDVPFQNVAAFNMAKLLHRREFGKKHDIQFDTFYDSHS
jgi:hypothetical protein